MSGGGDLSLATRAVESALEAGASDAEAFLSEAREREVRVHGGEVESLSAATQRGMGVRAWIGHRVGYAFGTDLGEEGIAGLASRAAEAARASDEDEFAGPPKAEGSPPSLQLTDPSIESASPAELAEIALAVERSAMEADPRVTGVEAAVYGGAAERVAITSSAGMAGEFEASSCSAYVQVLAAGEAGVETGLGFQLARGPAGLDPHAIGKEGAARATAMIGAGKPESRSCPVVLDPIVAASFAGLIGGVLGANAVQRGRSPFAGRLGDEVAGEALVLHDDGTDPEGPNSSPFDGEGTPRRRTALIEGGRLRAYLYDSYTARRAKAASTANAGRGSYRTPPGVTASNLIVAPGELSFEQLLAEVGEGVFVTDVVGLHSGVNPVSGVFSVGASGRAIRRGELAEPLREFTIASDLVSMLRAVRAAGSTPRWVPFGGSVSTPPLLIGEMAVGGS
ncbi:MAG TPA: TldD/PmbA family protein [Solirubrobacterales bacterium]|nr:TldD/PmbA family protein [Solirubrobacterales bacterium]